MNTSATTILHQIIAVSAPTVDVVFVHGLDGHYDETWQMTKEASWKDWISGSVPSANVWSLSYRIKSSNWAGGSMPLYERATQVLHVIEGKLKAGLPIVFVCHSYGGLVVKKMIQLSRTHDSRFMALTERVGGIVFFSTPHLGSSIPAYLTQLDRLLVPAGLGGIIKLGFRESFAMRELNASGQDLQELAEWYEGNNGYPAVDHVVFCEHIKTRNFMIVDKGSARLPGIPAISWDSDHIDICKPSVADLRVDKTIELIKKVGGFRHPAPAAGPAEDVAPKCSPDAPGATRASRDGIVVIGAIMADIVVVPEGVSDRFRDKIGTVDKIVVGGCAFNIFWHLRRKKIKCTLFSAFRADSPFLPLVEREVEKAGGEAGRIQKSADLPEAIFIGQRDGSGLMGCISSTSLESAKLDYAEIERAMRHAAVAVIDLSLSPRQVAEIVRICRRTGTELLCNGTSDGRIKRLAGLDRERIDALICTEDEFAVLTELKLPNALSKRPQEICKRAACDKLIVTRGEKGFVIFDPLEDKPLQLEAGTEQSDIVSSMGAGDAFTACYAAVIFEDCRNGRPFSLDRLHIEVKTYMPEVLGTSYSTHGGSP